jgi:S1-C subfamily serine protease
MKQKIRIIVGVVWILVFVSFIFTIYSISNKNNPTGDVFSNFSSKISTLLNIFGKSGSSPDIFRQKVVQEESAVIDVVDKVSPAVVSIIVKTTNFDFFSGPSTYESGIGTGFIVDSTGLIITNSHVVDDLEGEYSVVLRDGKEYKVEKIHLDKVSDVAILEIVARGLPVVVLGDSDSIKVGQKAIAIGNALGRFSNTVTAGVISGIARELEANSGLGRQKVYEDVIQTDAALNPGNSGGPLLNSAGQVVGINVATTYGADNISFAIPVNTLKPILEGFLKEGKIIRAYLGVSYKVITKEIAALNQLPEGAYIAGVLPGSPAEKSGLTRGDIVVKYGDKELKGQDTLSKMVSKSRVGEKIELVVDRDGKNINASVTLEQTPENF